MSEYEYRVSWRRAAWRDHKANSRLFETREGAERFIATRLYGRDRPKLSAITVTVSRRPVGPWERLDGPPGGAA